MSNPVRCKADNLENIQMENIEHHLAEYLKSYQMENYENQQVETPCVHI
jgi:hypothetical protein